MNVLGFDHYNLRGPRELLDRLRDFYTETIGLANGYRPPFNHFGYWLYAGERPVLHLSEASQGDEYRGHGPTTFDHAALNCTGLAEYQQKLQRLGVEYTRVRVPNLNRVQLFIRDPAGNGVELNFADE